MTDVKEDPLMTKDEVEEVQEATDDPTTPVKDVDTEKVKAEEKKYYDDMLIDAPMREVSLSGGLFSNHSLAFNPVTSLLGLICLWGAAIW